MACELTLDHWAGFVLLAVIGAARAEQNVSATRKSMEKADADLAEASFEREISALARLLWYAKGEAASLGQSDAAALIGTALLSLRAGDSALGPECAAPTANSAQGRPLARRWKSWIRPSHRKIY